MATAIPARRSDSTRAAILAAARQRFSTDGYERATIRAIAADADIDPSMVMRYYGNKEKLFAAAAVFDLRLPDLGDFPPSEWGARLAAHIVDRWDGDETLLAFLRVSVTNEAIAAQTREIFAGQLGAVVKAASGGDALAEQRAGLVSSQVLGFALTRYILKFPSVVELNREDVVRWFGPTIQRYLTG